ARPRPVERLRADRREDRQAGHTQEIQATIRSLAREERTPQRIAVAAEIDYRYTRLDANGKPVGRTPATTLRNVYVFGRDGDAWRLAATYSGQ
ncbi:MAG: IMS domain-containing protein, partial [Synechococcaceae cyanobacterium]